MSRRLLSTAVFAALAMSFLAPNVSWAADQPLSPSAQSAIKQLISLPSNETTVLVNSEAVRWMASRNHLAFRYLAFGWYSVKVPRVFAIKAFASLPMGSISPNRINKIAAMTQGSRGASDPPMAYPREIIGADTVHASGNRGAGETVAIIDTGIDETHPFFRTTDGNSSRINGQACFATLAYGGRTYPCLNGQGSDTSAHSANISNANSSVQDTLGHGTHVAGIAAGNVGSISSPPSVIRDGIAPDAGIAAIRVFADGGAYDEDILAALSWVATHAASLNIASVNLSLGGNPDDQCTSGSVGVYYSSYQTAFQNLVNLGVAPVLAAGNDSAGAVSGTAAISVPGCINPGISVASTDYNDLISTFSNVGYDIDLAAPGHNIASSYPLGVPLGGGADGWVYMSGTSMASPVVAGAFALARAASPTTTISDWLSLMRSTGTLVDDVYVQNIPRINIDLAIEASNAIGTPLNVYASTLDYETYTVTWSAPSYGPAPTGYRITLDDVSADVSAATFSYTGTLEHANSVIQVRTIVDGATGFSSNYTVLPIVAGVTPLYRTNSVIIQRPKLGGDECVSPTTDSFTLQYESPTTPLRTVLFMDGAGNAQLLSETIPSPIPDGLSSVRARQLVIASPLTTVTNASQLYVVSPSKQVGPLFSLSTAYSLLQASPTSPEPVSNLQATPGRLSATVSWQDEVASQWRLYVDGVSQGVVSSKSVNLTLSAGSHNVGVCALKDTSDGVYSSLRQSVSFSVSDRLSQVISASVSATMSLNSPTSVIDANTNSNLALAYTSNTSGVCSVSSLGVVTALASGNCSVTVSQAGDVDYQPATSVTLNIFVLQQQSVSFTEHASIELGTRHQIVSNASSGLPVAFESLTAATCSVEALSGFITPIAPGVCQIKLTQSGSAIFDSANITMTSQIIRPKAFVVRALVASVSKLKLTLKWTAPSNASLAAVTKYLVKYRVGTKGTWKSIYVTKRTWTSVAFAKNVRVYYTVTAVGTRGLGLVTSGNRVIK